MTSAAGRRSGPLCPRAAGSRVRRPPAAKLSLGSCRGRGDQVAEVSELTLREVAERAGVTPSTVQRWVREGLVPSYDGTWTTAAGAQVRVIARLRARGHSLEEIRQASDSGRLAFSYIEELLPQRNGHYTLSEAARQTGLEPALIQRIYTTMGFSTLTL